MIFALMLAATASTAHPVYLRCTFPANGAVFDVTADEPNSKVTTVLLSSGYVAQYPAAFTATQVRFENGTAAFVLDRTNLSIKRTIKMLASDDDGTCALQQAPKRAF